jgi:chitinase
MKLHGHYGIAHNHIGLTPMNGTNDVAANVFSLANAATMSQWASANTIVGVHYRSMDRDPNLSYTNQFISSLGL